MANEYKFPKVYPIDSVQFYNGEQPSPAKFTGIFKYINSAFFSIENFLGNGIDFAKPEDTQNTSRYNILSLTGAIGHTDSIYSSVNKLDTLENIAYKFCVTDQTNVLDKAVYNSTYSCLDVIDSFSIPIGKKFNHDIIIGVTHNTKGGLAVAQVWLDDGTQLNIDMTVPSVVSNPQPISGAIHDTVTTNYVLKYTSIKVDANKYITAIHFDKNSALEFKIFSIVMVQNDGKTKFITNSDGSDLKVFESSDNSKSIMPLNVMYTLGTNSTSFGSQNIQANYQAFSYKIKCKWWNVCTKTIHNGNCIGNTYDYYVNDGEDVRDKIGKVECAGSKYIYHGANSVDATTVPHNGNGDIIQYDPDTANPPNIVTLQSPLFAGDKRGALRLHPVFISDTPNSIAIGDNQIAVYDKLSATSPFITTSMLYAAGLGRSDMAFMPNKNSEINIATLSRYIIVGGSFGIADAFGNAENNDHAADRAIAVYAE